MIKPQDIIVLIKLHLWDQGRWKILPLAKSIFLSPSETHAAMKRLEKASLFDPVHERPRVDAMEEFLAYGLKYTFPAEMGPQTRGMPTAHSTLPMSKLIVATDSDIIVWPYENGKKRGFAITPLYHTVPQAAENDSKLYEYLALIDSLRVGRAREQSLAKDELVKRIREKNDR